MSTLPLTKTECSEPVSTSQAEEQPLWPALPTETEIYILPDGQVIVADLPVELAELLQAFGQILSCQVDPAA